MKERISEHLSYDEAMASSTAERLGIDNTPSPEILEVIKRTAKAVFDPLRDHFNCRIAVTSFYRCNKVNAVLEKNPDIVASKKSQHILGEAMDINGSVFGGVTNRQIFEWIRENLEFDQLIWEDAAGDPEPEWIHVSLKGTGHGAQGTGKEVKNRMEVLKRTRVDGKTRYEKL